MKALRYHIARRLLKDLSKEHLKSQPQVATFAFDLITIPIHLDGQYEREELELLSRSVFPKIDQNSACLDVGANIGGHSIHFANHFNKVISLEPHPKNFALLKINSELKENILPLNIGASDKEEVVEIVEDHENLAASSLHRTHGRTGRRVQFELKTIDSIPEIQEVSRFGFMKFDVEGHEANAIAGAATIIARDRPIILLEILKDEISDGTAASIETLRRLGYCHFHIAIEDGLIGKLPRKLKKPFRTLATLFTGKRPPKAQKLVEIERLEKKNYLMVLCAVDAPLYAKNAN